MNKSQVIATCLYNSSFVNSLEQGETRIAEIFAEHFNGHSFERWNSELSHKVSEKIISTVGRSSRINVKYFIEDSAFFKVVVIIRLVIKRLFFLDLGEPHQRVHSS